MAAERPLVSVLFPTYNHERYVAAALRSVLNQTLGDLEVIVVDDGSTDDTASVLDQFHDPRIVRVQQSNSGPSQAINRAVALARGTYVAQMSGDDLCLPDRLERQVALYRKGPSRLLFSTAEFIDENDRPAEVTDEFRSIFPTHLRKQSEYVRRFFDCGNCVNAVTAFTERDVLATRRFDAGLYQSQDFDMWAQLVKRVPIEVDPKPTICYRIIGGSANLSAMTPGRYLRAMSESLVNMGRFFEGMSDDLFREAFADRLRYPKFATLAERACEEAFLYLTSPLATGRLLGIQRLFALVNDPDIAPTLAERYGYDPPTFARMLLTLDPLTLLGDMRSRLYLDTGAGFNHNDLLTEFAYYPKSEFSFTFDLSRFPFVRSLRWDPVEGALCKVNLTQIEWRDRSGNRQRLDPKQAEPNLGHWHADGSFGFSTVDPWFSLPIQGQVSSVTISGVWSIEPASVSLNRVLTEKTILDELVARRLAQVEETRRQLNRVQTVLAEELPSVTDRAVDLEEQILEQERLLVRVEVTLAERERQLMERDDELAERQRELDVTREELAAIRASRGYQWVSRLRRIWRTMTGRAA